MFELSTRLDSNLTLCRVLGSSEGVPVKRSRPISKWAVGWRVKDDEPFRFARRSAESGSHRVGLEGIRRKRSRRSRVRVASFGVPDVGASDLKG